MRRLPGLCSCSASATGMISIMYPSWARLLGTIQRKACAGGVDSEGYAAGLHPSCTSCTELLIVRPTSRT